MYIVHLVLVSAVKVPLKAAASIFFTPFFSAVYIVERLVLQTENFSINGPKQCTAFCVL